MSITSLRTAVTTAGGTPTRYDHAGLLRELITAWGGSPTKWSVNELLREAITEAGGTPTQFLFVPLLRELVTALGGTPATYQPDALMAQIAGLAAAASAFDPLSISPNVWYDPSDLTTLFQDAAGIVPVAANNDPVRRINDKSGNAKHLTAASDAARPLYKTAGGLHWLEFDGVDDSLLLAATVNLAQPWDRVSAIRSITWTNIEYIMSGTSSGVGGLVQVTATPQLGIYDGTGFAANNSNLAVGTNGVVTEHHQGASSSLQVNNGTATTGNPGTSNPNAFSLGANHAASFSNCRIYGVIAKNGMSAGQITSAKTYMAAKAGVSL